MHVPLRQPHCPCLSVFTEIFAPEVNLAVWERQLSSPVASFAASVLASPYSLTETCVFDIEEEHPPVLSDFALNFTAVEGHSEFRADVAWLMHAYGCLTGARQVGLRIRTLRKAMCPRYHVDWVSLRLITTYAGTGSQWLEEGVMDRARLSDPAAEPVLDARQLMPGSVALFKGERWEGNEGRGIIHRSPAVEDGQARLVMTLDWLK